MISKCTHEYALLAKFASLFTIISIPMKKNISKDTKGFTSKANRSENKIKIFLVRLDIKSLHTNIPNYKGI